MTRRLGVTANTGFERSAVNECEWNELKNDMQREKTPTAVALHAVLGILDHLVEAALVLLASSVGSNFVLHSHPYVALGADLVALVVPVVVESRWKRGVNE